MQPVYATVSSSGGTNSSPWRPTATHLTPFQLGLQVQSSGGNWQIDVTMDDPTFAFPNPTLNPGRVPGVMSASAVAVTVFQSSQVGGWGGNNSSGVSNNNAAYCFGGGAGNAIGGISQPITAWRLTSTSTTAGGVITATALQMGVRQ